MSVLLTTILPALVPAIADGVRGIFARFTNSAGAAPQNVAERISLMQAEVARLEALAKLDNPAGEVSRWVADLRGSFRYVCVGGVIAATLGAVFVGIDPAALAVLLDLAGASMSFIIGERMYLGLRK